MAEIRDTLVLDVREALAEIARLQRRLTDAVDAEVKVDSADVDRLSRSLATAEKAAENLRAETAGTADAAARSQRSYDSLATALGVSESRAAALAGEAKEAAFAASDIEREARDIATQMGLTESETRAFTSSLRAANRQSEGLERSSRNVSDIFGRLRGVALGLVGGFLGFQAVEATFRGAASAITAYSDSVEEASKAETVFGDSVEQINEFVADSAVTLRASRTEATQAAAAFGAFFTGIGIAQGAAADLSQETVQLAADLASFNNLEFDEALQKLRSGLAGETEPLRQLGAGFNAAELQAKAFELGLGGVNGELTEAEKVTARLALITERTATAQGDAARTADQLAGRIRIARAQVLDLAPAFGEALLPVVETLLEVAPDLLLAIEGLVPVVNDLAREVGDLAPEFVEFAESLPSTVTTTINLARTLRDVGQAGNGLRQAAGNFRELAASIGQLRFDDADANLVEFGESVRTVFGEFNDIAIDQALQRINTGLSGGLSEVEAYATAISKLSENVQLTEDDLTDLANAANLDQATFTDLENLSATIDTLGLEPGQADAIVTDIGRVQAALSAAAQEERDISRRRGGARGDTEGLFANVGRFAIDPIPNLRRLDAQLADTETTLLEFAQASAESGNNVLETLGPMERVRAAVRLIGEAATDASGEYRSAFDLILEKTIEVGKDQTEQVSTTAADLVTSFEEQAQALADFDAAIATLSLTGFDDLASRLQSEGPAALGQALGFIDDIDLATRAEDALEGQGVQVSDSIQSELDGAIDEGDFTFLGTQAGLGVVDGLISPVVIARLNQRSAELASRMTTRISGDLEIRSPSRVMMRLGEFAGQGLIEGFAAAANRRVPVLTGIEFPNGGAGGAGGAGGGSTTTVTNNVNASVTLAPGDASLAAAIHQQQLGTVSSALRGFR